jgi:hypothetical protein
VRTYSRSPAAPGTPRERLAARLVEQAFRNYRDLGFPIRSLSEAGGPVVLIDGAEDLGRLDRVGFNPGERLEGTTPEDAAYDRRARAWVLRFVFTNDGGPTLIVPDEPWLPAGVRAWLASETSR